jgi:cell division protein FtsB
MNQKNINTLLKILIVGMIFGNILNYAFKSRQISQIENNNAELKNQYNQFKAENDKLDNPEYQAKIVKLNQNQTAEDELIIRVPDNND